MRPRVWKRNVVEGAALAAGQHNSGPLASGPRRPAAGLQAGQAVLNPHFFLPQSRSRASAWSSPLGGAGTGEAQWLGEACAAGIPSASRSVSTPHAAQEHQMLRERHVTEHPRLPPQAQGTGSCMVVHFTGQTESGQQKSLYLCSAFYCPESSLRLFGSLESSRGK